MSADHAATLVENFRRLWSEKDPEIVREIVADDAVAHWSGIPTFRGTDYPTQMRRTMTETFPDIDLVVTAHAHEGDYVFISWHARATVSGVRVEWDGIDRFRLRGGALADEVYAIYDTGPMREAARQARRATAAG